MCDWRVEQLNGAREAHVRILASEHGARHPDRFARAEDHGRSARRFQQPAVSRIRQKREVARLSVFDSGYANDVDVARISFEAALEPFSDVAQLQNGYGVRGMLSSNPWILNFLRRVRSLRRVSHRSNPAVAS